MVNPIVTLYTNYSVSIYTSMPKLFAITCMHCGMTYWQYKDAAYALNHHVLYLSEYNSLYKD